MFVISWPMKKPLVLGGDFNVCPTDDDVYDPNGFANDALCRPESRSRFRSLCHLGLDRCHPSFPSSAHTCIPIGTIKLDDGIETKAFALIIYSSLLKPPTD